MLATVHLIIGFSSFCSLVALSATRRDANFVLMLDFADLQVEMKPSEGGSMGLREVQPHALDNELEQETAHQPGNIFGQ
jgi:hypothetical protein